MTVFNQVRSGVDSRSVTFRPVEEVEASSAGDKMREVLKRGRWSLSSYGAFLVRGGGAGVRDECFKLIMQGKDKGGEMRPYRFGTLPNHLPHARRVLHDDEGHLNDVTVHYTAAGSVDAIIFDGWRRIRGLGNRHINTPIAARLFEEGVLPIDHDIQALRATLEPGDVLVFDHSRSHAFRKLTDVRSSVSYTWEPLPKGYTPVLAESP